jgi:hypothetical protein
MTSESWRRNGTCGACAHFQTDFGAEPDFYGHCKMYVRSGSRSSNDATCHEFKPLDGFAEKVVLNVRTTVPDSSRRSAAPVYSERDGVLQPARDAVRPRLRDDRERDDDDDDDTTETTSVVRRRRDGEEVEVVAERAPESSIASVAAAVHDPAGALDSAQLEEAMLDVLESHGAIAPTALAKELDGAIMVLKPADAELKPHEVEIETFFHKVVMIRDRLRVLEQKVNAHGELSDLEKVEMQAPITRVYQALTAFNPIFRPSANKWRARRPTRRPLEDLLKRWLPRETVELGAKWIGGTMVIKGSESEGHEVSIDLVFDRIVRLKKRFRELEHAIKQQPKLASDRDALLDYISKCYGTLTTFNVLFRHRDDGFSSK